MREWKNRERRSKWEYREQVQRERERERDFQRKQSFFF